MIEKADRGGHHNILSQAPQWFCDSVDRNLISQGKEPLNVRGRKNNDHRFTQRQRDYNKAKASEMAKPQNAVERVREQAKRLRASKKRAR